MSVKMLAAVLIGVLLLWVSATGRLGSLLGSLVTPTYMVQGTPPSPAGVNPGSATGTVNQNIKNIAKSKGVLSDAEIATYAVGAGLTNNLATAVAIALAESGGNTQAISATGDYGVWQINKAAHPAYSTSQLLDPSYNAAAMVTISSNGQNWNPWTTYRSGAYQKYMSRGQTAANNVFAGV